MMNKIPLLLQASREPKIGERILTTSDVVSRIEAVDRGFVTFNSASGTDVQLPVSSLRWFRPLNLWAPHEEKK